MKVRKIQNNLIFFFCFSIFLNITPAQSFEMWSDFNLYYKINSDFGYFGEAGFRNRFTQNDISQFLLSANLFHKQLNWLDLLGGLRYFHTNLFDGLNTNELRPWIGFKIHIF